MNKTATEAQIATFLDKYEPAIAAQLREARVRLRALFPRGYELVYDNYNALVFGIAHGERATDAFVSVAGYPRWVTLFFLRGIDLDDPLSLLEGGGAQVRSVRLKSPRDIDTPGVRALIEQAGAAARDALENAPRMHTLIKSISPKQRPRRPAPASKPARTARASKRNATRR